jgi:hypothetical protein
MPEFEDSTSSSFGVCMALATKLGSKWTTQKGTMKTVPQVGKLPILVQCCNLLTMPAT